jgi:hypothetical protein
LYPSIEKNPKFILRNLFFIEPRKGRNAMHIVFRILARFVELLVEGFDGKNS